MNGLKMPTFVVDSYAPNPGHLIPNPFLSA